MNPERNPWSEMAPPKLALQSLRFITRDVALADAEFAQYGSTLVRRAAVLLVMKREDAG